MMPSSLHGGATRGKGSTARSTAGFVIFSVHPVKCTVVPVCTQRTKSMNFTTTDVLVGSAVTVKTSSGEKTAVIRFMGMTSFASGEWVGVELDTAEGKNSGCVNGLQYFHCKPNHGMFVRPHSVKKSCDGIAPSNKENLDKTSHTAPTIAILSKQNALSKPGPSNTHSVSMSTMSIKTGMSDFSITGKRKNKMKGKAGMLIYNKLVGEADGGKELPREEVEQLKEIYKKSWENRPYIYWMRKTPSRRECIRIRPQNKCHCSHTFKSHEWWDLKNRKGKCRVPGCQCTCFQYLHYQGSMTFNCKCRHAATKHRLNGAPSSCQHTETTLARSGKSTKTCPCEGFHTTFSCKCGYGYKEHEMVWESAEERRAMGLPIDTDTTAQRIRSKKRHGCGRCVGCKCGMACKLGANNPWQSNGAGFTNDGKFYTEARQKKHQEVIGGGGKRFS